MHFACLETLEKVVMPSMEYYESLYFSEAFVKSFCKATRLPVGNRQPGPGPSRYELRGAVIVAAPELWTIFFRCLKWAILFLRRASFFFDIERVKPESKPRPRACLTEMPFEIMQMIYSHLDDFIDLRNLHTANPLFPTPDTKIWIHVARSFISFMPNHTPSNMKLDYAKFVIRKVMSREPFDQQSRVTEMKLRWENVEQIIKDMYQIHGYTENLPQAFSSFPSW